MSCAFKILNLFQSVQWKIKEGAPRHSTITGTCTVRCMCGSVSALSIASECKIVCGVSLLSLLFTCSSTVCHCCHVICSTRNKKALKTNHKVAVVLDAIIESVIFFGSSNDALILQHNTQQNIVHTKNIG